MVFPVALALIPQCGNAVYNPCKDLILYLNRRRREFKDLVTRIGELKTTLRDIESEKQKIDQFLKHSVFTQKSGSYSQTVENIADIHSKCTELIIKYTPKISGNQPSSITELEASSAVRPVIEELENFKSLIIEVFENLKRKRLSLKWLKLAKLSRDIARLNTEGGDELDRLKLERMTVKKVEANQEKLAVDDDLPVLFQTYVDEVVRCLCENEKTVVGIFGAPGVGKTTVMKKLYNQLVENRSLCGGDKLDLFVWAVCPQERETQEKIVEKLQKVIMMQLGIDHERTESLHGNANTISTFLRDKKYVLLLDQVTNVVNLDDVGLKAEHENKKVVIASSVREVMRMMTEHDVEIQRLAKGDAWELFNKSYGKTLPQGRLSGIADRIIELCDGLPWAIDRIGKYLKGEEDNEDLWNGVKNSLQSDCKSLDIMDLAVIGKVYEIMYEKLDTDCKKCSLYGALFPCLNKIYIDYLIECWIAEGFINKNGVQKVESSRQHGQLILVELTRHHLLRLCSDKNCIVMPMEFRRVALTLVYPGEENGVTWMSCDYGETTTLHDQTWSEVRRVSLIGCRSELPESPNWCRICTLLLQLKPSLESLGELFFDHMQSLQVLDLNHTEIRALPASISKLVKLKNLYLNDCKHLNTLPPEAALLEKLQFLDISGTSIRSLPQEIRYMVDLRCLRASFSANLEPVIPPGIISNLRNLEELSIDAAFDYQGGIAVAEEIASLKYLTTLRFNFPNVSSVDTFVVNQNLRSFKIFIGSQETRHRDESEFSGTRPERWLRYSTNEEFSPACNALLKQASDFEITGYDGVESLSLCQFELHSVKVCAVERCNSLRNIVDGNVASEEQGIVEGRLLENLEKLYLYDLHLLQSICEGAAPSRTLTNLATLVLNNCPKLTKILDSVLTRTLHSLKHLQVENCCEISHIVEVDDNLGRERHDTPEIVEVPTEGSSNTPEIDEVLKSLRTMKLSNLPNLQCICRNSSISLKSLSTITIKRCPILRNLSLSSANAEKLPSIRCERSWWDALPPSEQQCLRYPEFFTEEFPEPEARPEGEQSSSTRRAYVNGEETSSNKSRTAPSRVNVDHGEQILEEEIRPVSDDNLQASNMVESGVSVFIKALIFVLILFVVGLVYALPKGAFQQVKKMRFDSSLTNHFCPQEKRTEA